MKKALALAFSLLVPCYGQAEGIPNLSDGDGVHLGDPVNTETLSTGRGRDSGVGAVDWQDSPINPRNSTVNPENTSIYWRNNPVNPANSPIFPNNPRTIRDNDGNAVGYAVPKAGGGVNYFDYNGNRIGYENGR